MRTDDPVLIRSDSIPGHTVSKVEGNGGLRAMVACGLLTAHPVRVDLKFPSLFAVDVIYHLSTLVF